MVAFAESVARGADPVAAQTDALAQAGNKAVGSMVANIQTMVDQAGNMPELQQAMLDAYGNLGGDELAKVMAAAFALAELKGMDSVSGG